MRAYILSDEDYKTAVCERLSEQVLEFFGKRGFETERKGIKKGELHFCRGCFGCWTKKPGECVIDDPMAEINRSFNNSDVVVYLCPIVFGQFSPNIKNALDRWLPNLLPLFVKQADGTTGHPQRYASRPRQIVIGYGDEVSAEDARLFTDIVRHRPGTEVLVRSGPQGDLSGDLGKIRLERVRDKR